MRSCGWLILKFSSDRSVWAPQYLSDCTWTSPKASLSVRVLTMVRAVKLNWRRWRRLWVLNGVYLVGWRATAESGRAFRAQQVTEGLVVACAHERIAPASARRRLVRAVRNMVEELWGDGARTDLDNEAAQLQTNRQETPGRCSRICKCRARSSQLCKMLPREKSGPCRRQSRPWHALLALAPCEFLHARMELEDTMPRPTLGTPMGTCLALHQRTRILPFFFCRTDGRPTHRFFS
jgi:hypothetical protein